MKTRIILLSLLFVFNMFRCSGPTPKEKEVEPQNNSTRNDLPKMAVTSLDKSQINVRELKGNTILVLFQPDCDHCQREAKEIRDHLDAFKKYNLYFISADKMLAIEKFAKDYDLLGYGNINFGLTTVEDVINNFGPIDAPSVYIYLNQQLVQQFNGETPIEKILQAI